MKRPTDPTLTLTVRSRAVRECNRRFESISRAIRAAFSLGDYTDKPWPFSDPVLLATDDLTTQGGGLLANAAKPKKKKPKAGYKRTYKLKSLTGAPSMLGPESTGNGYVFQRNEANLYNFDKWLDNLINTEILQPTIPLDKKWLSSHLGAGYTKGASMTRAKATKQLAKKVKLTPSHPFSNPAHVERARLIYLRNFNDMEGITSTMKTQMRRILAEGVMRGQNPNEIAKLLTDRVDKIGKVRARMIARTEIVEAHQEASINEAEELERETGYTINMEWSCCKDGRERPTHAERDGKIYTKEKARTLLGEPNCRCGISPHIAV